MLNVSWTTVRNDAPNQERAVLLKKRTPSKHLKAFQIQDEHWTQRAGTQSNQSRKLDEQARISAKGHAEAEGHWKVGLVRCLRCL